ncbi:hypothetical protein SAMD00019534_041010 [Acytostelium subglobosum LB1]|uniref:hypothetical protein n=1 Tax=Acytostelium subglobosum LB1 TaxID=1410327 RepID=UPI000644D367|nr:hypothetical protein SAMD00019534_041010 [Acytostelium subglobosum LB1]GAM20926.1 hypothetical protein SAMD00019534_041010 [Acytostelium subglobosum LB1]|eukprot:XP_012756060.1 hypothetical protein SAMD00019534_041010 [Acytostelium subglobosum LB1]
MIDIDCEHLSIASALAAAALPNPCSTANNTEEDNGHPSYSCPSTSTAPVTTTHKRSPSSSAPATAVINDCMSSLMFSDHSFLDLDNLCPTDLSLFSCTAVNLLDLDFLSESNPSTPGSDISSSASEPTTTTFSSTVSTPQCIVSSPLTHPCSPVSSPTLSPPPLTFATEDSLQSPAAQSAPSTATATAAAIQYQYQYLELQVVSGAYKFSIFTPSHLTVLELKHRLSSEFSGLFGKHITDNPLCRGQLAITRLRDNLGNDLSYTQKVGSLLSSMDTITAVQPASPTIFNTIYPTSSSLQSHVNSRDNIINNNNKRPLLSTKSQEQDDDRHDVRNHKKVRFEQLSTLPSVGSAITNCPSSSSSSSPSSASTLDATVTLGSPTLSVAVVTTTASATSAASAPSPSTKHGPSSLMDSIPKDCFLSSSSNQHHIL